MGRYAKRKRAAQYQQESRQCRLCAESLQVYFTGRRRAEEKGDKIEEDTEFLLLFFNNEVRTMEDSSLWFFLRREVLSEAQKLSLCAWQDAWGCDLSSVDSIEEYLRQQKFHWHSVSPYIRAMTSKKN